MTPVVSVIIPTKDRAGTLERYALASLARSSFRDFSCVVWDASVSDANVSDVNVLDANGGGAARAVVEERQWNFDARYFVAPRKGLPSQRNDAVSYVLGALPTVRYIVFIDDDCELSEDALAGVMDTFRDSEAKAKENRAVKRALIVNIRTKPLKPSTPRSLLSLFVKRLLGMNRHGVTPFLYNYGGEDEPAGIEVDWAGGGCMAADVSVFRDLGVFFPEEFQRFGGYALGEDLAFSLYARKKFGVRIVNSLYGHLFHHHAGGSRLDVKNMAASKWYNFHLLFDAVYGNEKRERAPKIRFKLFMIAAALKLLLRARSVDVPSVLRGIREARRAYKEYRSKI